MENIKRSWRRLPVAVRKPLVLMVGTIVLLAGVVLLPLPGPGWLIIFLGLAILATEFTLAEKARIWLMDKLKQTFEKTKDSIRKPK